MKIFSTLSGILSLFLGVAIINNSFAVDLPNPPQSDPALIGFSSLLATVSPNLKQLPGSLIGAHVQTFSLKDGSKISGLFFKGPQTDKNAAPLPLILANFGLFSNQYSRAISDFVNSFLVSGRLQADVLIVDSVTSGIFYSQNNEIGLGGYDEGRILIELTGDLEKQDTAARSVYLFGVSLGGNAVMQALLEDQRLGLHLFKGAIAFSSTLNEEESSQTLLSFLGHPLKSPLTPAFSEEGKPIVNNLFKSMIDGVLTKASGQKPDPSKDGDIFFSSFEQRLKRLNTDSTLPDWNPAILTDSAEDYIQSSSDLLTDPSKGLNHLDVPVIVVNAKNDPVVPFSQFKAFAAQEKLSPNVFTHSTDFGGHWGFFDTYGADWIYDYIIRMESLASNSPS